MTEPAGTESPDISDRARVLYGVVLVLVSVGEHEAMLQALDNGLREAFTEGFYAGAEANDLVRRSVPEPPAGDQPA